MNCRFALRIFTILVTLSFPLLLSTKEQSLESFDFDKLMGKETSVWQYVQTPEDVKLVSFFKNLFEKNLHQFSSQPKDNKIPKLMHFIWLGQNSFPQESFQNVDTWIKNHPDWRFKFWVEKPQKLPFPEIEVVCINDYPFYLLENCYYDSENYGERSEILRYEILMKEGGVYVDYDMVCLKNIDFLASSFDFFCGLELPGPSILSSCIFPTSNLIAARASHPVLTETIAWLQRNWQFYGDCFPGSDPIHTLYRVRQRTLNALMHGIQNGIDQKGYKDIVLPAYFFNISSDKEALFAKHLHLGSWYKSEKPTQQKIEQELSKVIFKNSLLEKIAWSAVTAQGVLLVMAIIVYRGFRIRNSS